MTIECYMRWCQYHTCHSHTDDGPFCDEVECRATAGEMEEFKQLRAIELNIDTSDNENG